MGGKQLGMAVNIGDNSEWGQEVGHTFGLTFADTVGVSHLLRVRGKDRKKGSEESDKDSEKLWGDWNKQLIKAKKKKMIQWAQVAHKLRESSICRCGIFYGSLQAPEPVVEKL